MNKFKFIVISIILLLSNSIQAETMSGYNKSLGRQEFNYKNTTTENKASLIEVELDYFPKGSLQSIFHYESQSLPNEVIKVVQKDSRKANIITDEDYYYSNYPVEIITTLDPNQKVLFRGLTKANITNNNEISFNVRLHKDESKSKKESSEDALVNFLNKDIFIEMILTPNTKSQIILSNEDKIIIHAKQISNK